MTQIITTDQHVKQNVQNAAILVFYYEQILHEYEFDN